MIDVVLQFLLRYFSLLTLIMLSHEAGHILACKVFKIPAQLRWIKKEGFVVFSESIPRNKHIIVLWSGILLGLIPILLGFHVYANNIFDFFILIYFM